jgi:hypothetical protein
MAREKVNWMKRIKTDWKGFLIFLGMGGITVAWYVLYYEGHRFLPGAKWLSNVIPLWLVILNMVFWLFISLLIIKNQTPSITFMIVASIGFLLAGILWGIGFDRFTLVSSIGMGILLLVIWRFKKRRSKKEEAGPILKVW